MPNTPKIPESHLDIIQSEVMATVSTIRQKDGLISTNPVSFDWDGEHVRFSTLKQRVKYKNLLADPRITFCVVSTKDPTRYIEIRGTAQLVDDPRGEFQRAFWERVTGEKEFNYDPPGAERVTVTIISQQISTPLLYGGQMSTYAGE